MIRLQTFGGAVLYAADGERLLGAASQRRILALLSVLAASGERGLTRDKIVGILWPDSAPKRARHSLTQTMYAGRKAVDCDDLFQATEDIRLNPDRISSDVSDFEAAFRSGDDAAAAELYRGAFLDGFYTASSEFDWWLHHQRSRLEEQAATALQRLAASAEQAQDWSRAAARLRQLTAIRQSDSAAALRLMKALAAAGDRAGALQHALVHERLLREQFELEPEEDVLAFAAELRELRRSAEAAPQAQEYDIEPLSAAGPISVVAVAAATPTGLTDSPVEGLLSDGEHTRGRGPQRLHALPRKLRWALEVALTVAFAGALTLWLTHRPEGGAAHRSLRQRVVVAPFRVTGADRALDYLREGMVDMLSTRLADDTAARSVDPGAVLAAWRQAGITGTSDIGRDSVLRLAARLGAERIVLGSIVGTPGRMIVNASVLVVASGALAAQASVEGSGDHLAELVDQLAARLLLSEAGESDRLAGHITRSLPALRAYLTGVGADAQGDYALAARAYGRALTLDSAFALSALHLGVATGRLNDYDAQRQALHQAWRFRAGLSDRDEAELLALLGPRYPSASTTGQALTAWEQAARLAPNRGEVWFGLARRILTDGSAAGLGDIRGRALTALQRAVRLDRNDAAARLLLHRKVEATAPAQPFPGDSAGLPLGLFFRWWSAAEGSDAAALALLADSLPDAGPANLREIAAASAFEGLRPVDGARALEILAGRAADGDQALGLLIAQHSLALERGRPGRALEITREMARLGPIGRPHLRLRVLDAVFGGGDTAAAVEAATELQRTAANSDLPNASADACALAQWQLAGSDTAGARRSLHRLETAPADAPPAAVASPAPVCAALVAAALSVQSDRLAARAAVERVDSLVLTSVGAGDVAAYAPIVISRLYRRLGEPAQALAAIRRRPYIAAVWPRYLATELKEEAELARQTGDLSGAATAYRDYLALRDDPEPALEPEVRAVRDRVDASVSD